MAPEVVVSIVGVCELTAQLFAPYPVEAPLTTEVPSGPDEPTSAPLAERGGGGIRPLRGPPGPSAPPGPIVGGPPTGPSRPC